MGRSDLPLSLSVPLLLQAALHLGEEVGEGEGEMFAEICLRK